MYVRERMVNSGIPTADLSPFLRVEEEGDYEEKINKKTETEIIGNACFEYGFFQLLNHGVPLELMNKALLLSKDFFGSSPENKSAAGPLPDAPLPAGYGRQPEQSLDKNEYLLMFPPHSTFNVFPSNPQEFSEVLKELFSYFVKTASIVESIINDSLGLPPNFLSNYNNDRNWDLMTTFRYPPATDIENTGLREHKDVNCITFVFQDQVGGLEVMKRDGQWIPITPNQNAIVVNVGDVIQVLSNDRFKSASHRVIRQTGRDRYSFAFFYNIGGDKWVEPLPQFTEEIDEAPKYRGFVYKEYLQLRMRNKTHPPSRPQDIININHYSTRSHIE